MYLEFDNFKDNDENELWSIETTKDPDEVTVKHSNNAVNDSYSLTYNYDEEYWDCERVGSISEEWEIYYEPLDYGRRSALKTQLSELLAVFLDTLCQHLEPEERQFYLESFGLGEY